MGKTAGKFSQISNLSPEMQQANTAVLEQLRGPIENLGGRFGFDLEGQQSFQGGQEALMKLLGGTFNPNQISEAFQANVARPAIEQFQQQLAPSIQQAAVAAGGGRSSAVPAQIARAGERLQTNLAGQLLGQLNQSQESSLNRQQQAINQALGFAQAPQQANMRELQALAQMLGLSVNPSFQQNTFEPGKQGYGQAIGTVLGAAGGSYFGNPQLGAQIGGAIGGSI